MNSTVNPDSLVVFIAGFVFLISMMTVAFCVASLKSHVDETKIREEKNIAAIFRSPIPPEHLLTPIGKRRVKVAKIAMGVLALALVTLVIRNLVH